MCEVCMENAPLDGVTIDGVRKDAKTEALVFVHDRVGPMLLVSRGGTMVDRLYIKFCPMCGSDLNAGGDEYVARE